MPVTFLKRGKAAIKASKQNEAEIAQRRAENSIFRFYLPNDEKAKVTFLDGKLDENGILERVAFNEHRIKVAGRKMPKFYPCTEETEACPLCEQDLPRSHVCVFTVLDHRTYIDQSGKKHKHQRKLFVAKTDTMKRLQKLAFRNGGLRGLQIEIERSGDQRSPAVGTDFEVLGKLDPTVFMAKTGLKKEDLKPFVYDDVLVYHTAKELRKMGFGTGEALGHDDNETVRRGRPRDDEDEDEDEESFITPTKAKPKVVSGVDDDEDEESGSVEDEDEDEAPKAKAKKKVKVRAVTEDDDDDVLSDANDKDDDEDEPAPKKKNPAVKKVKAKQAVTTAEDEDDDWFDDEEASDADDDE